VTLALLAGALAGLLLGIVVPLVLRRRAAAAALAAAEAPAVAPGTVRRPATPGPVSARPSAAPAATMADRIPAATRTDAGGTGATGIHAAAGRTSRDFRGVSIRTGPGCCDAVRPLSGARYLATDAPQLPVAGCDRKQCTCSYQRLPDRRSDEERRFGVGQFGGFGGTSRARDERTGDDRRQR
jgi:hypothetical protein